MSSRGWIGVAALLAMAPATRAQDAQGSAGDADTSNAFQQACVDLVQGKPPAGGPDAADTLRKACDNLMSRRAQARRDAAERQQAQQLAQQQQPAGGGGQAAASGTGAGPEAGGGSEASQGTGLGAAFAQAGRELARSGGTRTLGRRSNGSPFGFTLVTNPVGWFNGLGINAEAFGVMPRLSKISWVGGARYSNTDATNGSVDTFGLEAGADYFLFGRNNEGLRLGPRIEAAFGRESFQTSTDFGWLGLSGEVGYNFIATNGITGALAFGLGGRVAGDERDDFASFTGGEFGPYLKVGLGYSW